MSPTTSHCLPLTDAELRRFNTEDDQCLGGLVASQGRLPLTAMKVEAHVKGLIAETRVTQTFQNTCAEVIEATYVFPLPDRASVTRFQMEVAGRLIEGIIDERGKARLEYEQAIAAGQRAALAEEDRPSVFSLQVGNLAPADVARIVLTLVGPLPVDAGEATFQFPLVVAPRYVPGRELPGPNAGAGVSDDTDAVPDASRISPPVLLRGCANPVRLSISVVIDGAGLSLRAPRSSLHAVNVVTHGGGYRIELEPGERLDRDFILRFRVGDERIQSSALLTPDRTGEGATLSVTIAPPLLEQEQRPRDVVFLLDRSGSMDGWKMVAARRAVARMVDTLTTSDRFSLTVFSDKSASPPQLSPGLEPASDRARFRAVEFLANVQAQGGTELAQPLARAAELLSDGYQDRERVLVLVTDGQVGNEDQILKELATRMKNMRVFTLGIDRAVNAGFLRRLAAAGGGACELVESEDRLDEVMAKVHRRIGTPLLSELSLSGDGIDFERDSAAPRRMPALFAGAPLLVSLRSSSARGACSVVVSGRTPAGQSFSQSIAVTHAAASDAPGAIWARAHIRDLEDAYVTSEQGKEKQELETRIVRTSLEKRVLSRFTAFLAVDRNQVPNADGNPRRILQAVEAPSGWDSNVRGTILAKGGAPAPCAMPISMAVPAAPAPDEKVRMARSFGAHDSSPPNRSRSGLLGRVGSLFKSEPEVEPSREEPALDDAPYLTRLRELSADIERSAAQRDARAFDLLVARLSELLEDMRSIGGFEELVSAVEPVLSELRALLGRDLTEASRLARELLVIAERSPLRPAPRPSPRAFWK